MKYAVLFAILTLTFSVVYYIHSPYFVQKLCDVNTCPVCYGHNLCKEFDANQITLQYNSINDYIYNIFSVKNVYFGVFERKKVVLKKLAHDSELKKLDNLILTASNSKLIDFLVSDSGMKRFKICDSNSAELFLQKFNYRDVQHIETILRVNAEPLLLEVFKAENGWRVPKLYGFCGRLVVMENTGNSLNYVQNFNWFDRAYLAFQLLQAAKNFTEDHEDFRLYLTDISPDNVAVSESLQITFVDLEDAILKRKTLNGTRHNTEHFREDAYSFSEKDICDSAISDHNIYSVCRLLLSKNALWPMMENGLLHTPPQVILETHQGLFENIELCVEPSNYTDRFKLHDELLKELGSLLKRYTHFIH